MKKRYFPGTWPFQAAVPVSCENTRFLRYSSSDMACPEDCNALFFVLNT